MESIPSSFSCQVAVKFLIWISIGIPAVANPHVNEIYSKIRKPAKSSITYNRILPFFDGLVVV